MKTTAFSIFLNLLFAGLAAQAPQKMSYQAVVRNALGELVRNTAVGMRITILQGTLPGVSVYTETQTPVTNVNGLVTVEIGGGTGFDAINWSTGIYYIKTETDPAGGTNYTISSISQLLSVPYALYSKSAENGSLWSKNVSNIYFNGGNVGIGITNPLALLQTGGSGTGQGNVLFTGQMKTINAGKAPVSGAGTRMMWYPDKAALRAGIVEGTQWDTDNIGIASTGLGLNTTAEGAYSASIGINTTAASYSETVIGYRNSAYIPLSISGWNALDRLFVVANGYKAPQNALTILKNGNTGIGTDTPSAPLVVRSNSDLDTPQLLLTEEGDDKARLMFTNTTVPSQNWTVSGYLSSTPSLNILNFNYYNGSTLSAILSISGDNKIGINTDSPPNALSVMGGAISLHTGGTGITNFDGLKLGFDSPSETGNVLVWNYENTDMIFGTNKQERIRIDKNGNVVIQGPVTNDITPDASLDVEGTMVVGHNGKIFSEIREITGTTASTGTQVQINFPSGYTMTNTRVLSLEIYYSNGMWVTLGTSDINDTSHTVSVYLAAYIYIIHPGVSNFQNKPFRLLLMKVE